MTTLAHKFKFRSPVPFLHLLFSLLTFALVTVAHAQETKSQETKKKETREERRARKAALKVEMPTKYSIMHDSLRTTLRKLVWYRFGPQVGMQLPTQAKLRNHFKGSNAYFSVALFASAPTSGFGLEMKLYSVSEPSRSFVPISYKGDRYYLACLGLPYTYYFKEQHLSVFNHQHSWLPYVSAEPEFLLGKLRIREENIDTKLKPSFGVYADAGVLIKNRWRFDVGYALLHPIKSYDLSNFSVSISYLFYSVHRW